MDEEKTVEISKEEVKEVKKEVKNRYEQVEVVTQTGLAVRDNKSEKVLSDELLLVEILNKLDNIEKAVA